MSIQEYSIRQLLEIDACTNCSLCADICPAVSVSGDALLSGVYRLNRLKKIQWMRSSLFRLIERICGRKSISTEHLKEYSETVFRCTLCGNCQETCPVGIRLKDLWISLRQDLVSSGTYPDNTDKIMANLLESHNVFAEDNEERADWADNFQDTREYNLIRDKAEVVYFTGCVASYFPMVQRIPAALVKIFKLFNVDFTLLGEDEWCCGFPLLGAGLRDSCQDIIEHNLNALRQKGAGKVVFACPSCYLMWQEYYPHEFEYIHETQFLVNLVRENRTRFKGLQMTVTYHDPCDLGRGGSVYDEPREIIRAIPGIRFVELPRNRENCSCCGGGGNLEMFDAGLSSDIAQAKVEEVMTTGAETVVTACQQCVRTMNTYVKRNRISLEVIDIAQLVERSLNF